MLKIKNQQYSRKCKSEQGFSIIEIVISLFLIGVSLMLFQVVAQTTVHNKANSYREVALRAAETKMQEFKTTAYASLPSSSTFSNSQTSSLPGGSGAFTITSLEDGISSVEVKVEWDSTSGVAKQNVTIQSYISSGGLGK